MRDVNANGVNASGVVLVGLIVIGLITSSGCGGQHSTSPDPTGQAGENSIIELALNWFPDAQHGGFYGAEVFGKFADQGLTVKIVPGGPGAPVVQNVALGRQLFGVGNADQILVARSQGAPVVAVLAGMQNSPRCIMARQSSGIRSFADLHDTKLALGTGKAFAGYLRAKLPLTNVTIVPYTGSIAPFLADEKLVQQAYVFSEPNLVRRHGVETVTLMVSDLGFNPYTSCLFTSEDVIQTRPELVAAVVQAVKAGWLAYLDDPAPVNSRILRDNPKMDLDSLEFGAAALTPLCLPNSIDPGSFGQMDEARWKLLCQQLIELNLVGADTDGSTAFTTQFATIEDQPRSPMTETP